MTRSIWLIWLSYAETHHIITFQLWLWAFFSSTCCYFVTTKWLKIFQASQWHIASLGAKERDFGVWVQPKSHTYHWITLCGQETKMTNFTTIYMFHLSSYKPHACGSWSPLKETSLGDILFEKHTYMIHRKMSAPWLPPSFANEPRAEIFREVGSNQWYL